METEVRLERFSRSDEWPAVESLGAMIDHQQAAFCAVRSAVPALGGAVCAAAERLRTRGRLIYTGAGASGRLAVQDGVELWPTFGWPNDRLVYLMAGGAGALVQSVEGAEDDGETGRREAEALALDSADVVIAVAASGTTPYTRGVVAAGSAAGALTIGFANNSGAPLLAEVELPVLLQTGPEFLAGSTRMCAGTAQKMALNLFSTQLMIELGRVYQGYMVNVVATNAKLVRRSQGIIQAITGCAPEAAAAAWQASGNDIRLAVLLVDGLERPEAEARLERANGDLRHARPIHAAQE